MPSQSKGGKKNSRTGRPQTKSGRKSSGRRKGAKTGGEGNSIPDALFTEISILFLLAFCIILILGNFGLTLRFGDVLNSLFFGLFGALEYVFPFFLFFCVCFYLMKKGSGRAIGKLISMIVLFFDIGMFLQLFVTTEYNVGGYSGTYDFSMSNKSGGGVIAGGLFETMKANIGEPATVIIMVIVLVICLLIITGGSVFKLLQGPGEEIADRARESRIEREKDREAIREERKLIRNEEKEERARKRAIEREEKRKKYREDTLNKKKNILSMTVGDDSKSSEPPMDERELEERGRQEEENSFRQNNVYEDDHPGYSPFAMSPEHMVKPKDYDKKIEPKPIPEVRTMEIESPDIPDISDIPEITVDPEISEIPGAVIDPAGSSFEMPVEKLDDNEAEESSIDPDEEFYNRLSRSHEVEDSDMHEITFDDDAEPGEDPFSAVFSEDRRDQVREDNGENETPVTPEDDRASEDEAFHESEEAPENEGLPEVEELYPEEEELPDIEELYSEEEEFPESEELYPEEEELPESEEHYPEDEELPESEELYPEDEEFPEDEDDVEEDDLREEQEDKPYELPPIDLLKKGVLSEQESENSLRATADRLKDILQSFGVKVRILQYIQGPTVTRFEMQPEQGVKVSTILNLSNDIQMNLAAKDIRIEAPIPGKAAVGIEIPNKSNSPVMLRDLIDSDSFRNARSKITFAVGKDIGGEAIVYDIDKMPHLLIAGATGSGKSVCINTIIMSILYKAKPDEVKLIMIDPKVVELSIYNGIPHLLTPVVTDPVKAAGALNWGVAEMMKRYQLFARVHVRNMEGYNEKVPELIRAGETLSDGSPYVKLPQIVIIVDELADLMMVQKKDVEASICRLAQLARAAGIHLIIATQRPSVDVITGLIKANMPSRVAFAVSSNVDSRTILDSAGAEKLLGNGDMLFYPQKYPKPERLQGAYVSDEEVQSVTDFIRNESASLSEEKEDIADEIAANISAPDSKGTSDAAVNTDELNDGRDAYFADAGRFVKEKKKATIGALQRVFRIGFNRAARIMDQLADAGVVSGEDGTKPREVLMSREEFEDYMNTGSDPEQGGNGYED